AVTDILLSAGIANDDAAGLRDDGAAAFLDLAALTTEVVEATRSLFGGAPCDRCERGGRGRRNGGKRRGNRRCALEGRRDRGRRVLGAAGRHGGIRRSGDGARCRGVRR